MSSSPIRYFEAKGETLKKLLALLVKRQDGLKAGVKWAKKYGGKLGTCEGFTRTTVALMLPTRREPNGLKINTCHSDLKNWKYIKGSDNGWEPRHSTKVGKALHEEMKKVAEGIPSAADMGDVIKLNNEARLHTGLRDGSANLYGLLA